MANSMIDDDDAKMEELLVLQSMAESEPEYTSIEEKYEDEIMMAEVMNMVNDQMANLKPTSEDELEAMADKFFAQLEEDEDEDDFPI